MRRVSEKTAARVAACQVFRELLVQEVGCCEICGHDPLTIRPGNIRWNLYCHEIARGADRLKALDKRFAILVVCHHCHMEWLDDAKEWPEAHQLASLKKSRPEDYDLTAYLRLKNPNAPAAITQDEVDAWLAKMP